MKRGALAQSADHFSSLSLQDLESPLGHPVLGPNAPNGMEAIGSLPQVFQNMDEIQNEGHIRSMPTNQAKDEIKLLLASVDQDRPRTFLFRIAAQRFVKHVLDHIFLFPFQTGPNPFMGWPVDGQASPREGTVP